jgi:Na+/proline symporter
VHAAITGNGLDILVVLAYLVCTFAFGVWATKFLRGDGTHSEESYYLAGRNVPGWLNGISVAVTAINADVAPFYCGLAVVIGLPVAWFYLSRFAVAWMILGILFAVRWRQLNIRTAPEFYQLRFGGAGSRFVRAYTALFAVLVNMVPWMGAGLLGVHKIMAPIFGYEHKAITLGFALPVLLAYVWIAGFAGVLITDLFQTGVILVASLILLIRVLIDAGGPLGLAEAVRSALPAESSEVLSVLPVAGHEILSPLAVAAWFIVPTIGQGGTLDLIGQRIFSCRSNRDAASVSIWAECALFAMLLLLTLPVLGILARHPELYHASASKREEVYGMLLDIYLPPGLLGLALAALLASVMSTLSSYFNYGAQTLVNDVFRQCFPRASLLKVDSRSALWVGWFTTLLMVVGAGLVVFATDSLFRIAIILVGMVGATASLYWGQWWWWRVNFWSWLSAMVGGPMVYWLLGAVLPHWTWWREKVALNPAMNDTMGMLQAVLGVGLTTILWVIVTLVTRPQPMSQLVAFYRRARPMGHWRPVREALAAETGMQPSPESQGLIVKGLALAMLGGGWVSLAVLAISQLMIGAYSLAGGLLLGSIASALLFRNGLDGYLKLLEVEPTVPSDQSDP